MVERGLESDTHPSDEPELEDDAVLELVPEVLAFMTAAKVNAFYNSRGNSGWTKPTRGMGGATCRSETFPEWHQWVGSRWRAGSWPGKEGSVCQLL